MMATKKKETRVAKSNRNILYFIKREKMIFGFIKFGLVWVHVI
jgi:hypothetical protein